MWGCMIQPHGTTTSSTLGHLIATQVSHNCLIPWQNKNDTLRLAHTPAGYILKILLLPVVVLWGSMIQPHGTTTSSTLGHLIATQISHNCLIPWQNKNDTLRLAHTPVGYILKILLPYRVYTRKKATYIPQKNQRRQSPPTAHRNTK